MVAAIIHQSLTDKKRATLVVLIWRGTGQFMEKPTGGQSSHGLVNLRTS